MARIPLATGFQPVQADTRVDQPAHMDTSVDSPSLAAIPGQQLEAAGRAMTGVSTAMVDIAMRMQNDANQVRVDDALNTARQKALNLAYDPQEGYLALQGRNALQNPDLSPRNLPQEYGEKLSDSIGTLSEGLSNDEQRRLFAMRANDVQTSFTGNVEQHTLQQFKSYSLSVQDGAIKLGADDAKRNWNDPLKIDTALASVQAAVVRAGSLQGEAANETLAKMKAATSLVHTGVIDAAIQNNNPTYASQYLQQYKDGMTADDILKVNGVINRDLDARISQQAVAETNQAFAQRFAPTDLDRLTGIVAGMESGGKDTKPDGTPMTSPKGALYKMQVMPATAANPGFGVRPAQDDSPKESNRVGVDMLKAYVTRYGNAAQAMAAYNAGPGAMDDAIKKANAANTPQAWLSFLPKETQSYVQKGIAKLGAGQGAAPLPTEQEYVQDAISRLGESPRPSQVTLTREAAEHQFAILTKSHNEQADQALGQVQQALNANGGNWSGVDVNLKMKLSQLAPGKVDDAMKYAKAVSKGDNETNPELYMKLATYPEEMTRLSDAQFMQLRTQLSEKDFDHFAKQRGDILNGKEDTSAEAINTKALNTAMSGRLANIGINPTPGPKDTDARAQIGTIQKYVRDDLFAQQAAGGKKLTPAEIEGRVDYLFARDVNFQKTFLGMGVGSTSQNMLSMKVSDIPSASLDSIKQAFIKQGTRNPSDDQLLRAYWTLKGRNG